MVSGVDPTLMSAVEGKADSVIRDSTDRCGRRSRQIQILICHTGGVQIYETGT